MMEMEADAAATASKEEEDGHLHDEGSDKGDMDSSQGRKNEEEGTPVSDEVSNPIAQLRETPKDTEPVAKDTANAIKCPNNGNQNKKTDDSHSKTCKESVEPSSSSDPDVSIDKPLSTQPSTAAAEPAKPLKPSSSDSSQHVLPSSTAVSVGSSLVPAILPKPSGEIPTARAEVSSPAALDVSSSPASDAAPTGTVQKTSPVSTLRTVASSLSRSVLIPSVTTTTPVKPLISSSILSGLGKSLTAKVLGENAQPSLSSQHKTLPSVKEVGPAGSSAEPCEKPAVVMGTSSKGPLPPKSFSTQPVTSTQATSPKPLQPKASSISSSVVSSSTSGKHIHKLPPPVNPTSTSHLTKNISPMVSSSSLSVSSTQSSSVSSSSPSPHGSLPSTSSQVTSSKTVSGTGALSILPATKPTVNPPKVPTTGSTTSQVSSNPPPIKLSRNNMPSPSPSSVPKRPTPSPAPGPSGSPDSRSPVAPVSSVMQSTPRPSQTFPHRSPAPNIRAPPSNSTSVSGASLPSTHPKSPSTSLRSPLPQRPPPVPQPSTPSTQRPHLPLRPSPAPPQQSRSLPTPSVSVTNSPQNQPLAVPSRPSRPLPQCPRQRPSLPSDNPLLPTTDFSVPDIRRDCPAGPLPAISPASIVPDVLRTGSEEDYRQLGRMLNPTPFGGGIPPPLMPDLCRRGQDVPLVPIRIISLPSTEVDIDLLRPASAAALAGPTFNASEESMLESQVDSSNVQLREAVEAESGVGGENNLQSPSDEQSEELTEQFQGAVNREVTVETTPLVVGRPSDDLCTNVSADSGGVAPPSSEGANKKDTVGVVLALGSVALPKEECLSKRDGRKGNEESREVNPPNVVSDSKGMGNETGESLETDVNVSAPVEGSERTSLGLKREAGCEAETTSKASGSSEKVSIPPKDDLVCDDKKLDLTGAKERPPCGDSSDDLKGERMTVERAELDKGSLVGEEESDSSLMLPPPIADLPANPAMEDGTKGGKGGEEKDGGKREVKRHVGGEGGSAERALPTLDGAATTSEKKADARDKNAQEESSKGVRSKPCGPSDAAPSKVSPAAAPKEADAVPGKKGSGSAAPVAPASCPDDKGGAPRLDGGGKRKEREGRPSEKSAAEKVSSELAKGTEKRGEGSALGKVGSGAVPESKVREDKKLSKSGGVTVDESVKASGETAEVKVALCEAVKKKETAECERLSTSGKVVDTAGSIETKDLDAVRKGKVVGGEGANGGRQPPRGAARKEEASGAAKAESASGRDAALGKVLDKSVCLKGDESSKMEKKELSGDVGKPNLAKLSSSGSADPGTSAADEKPCDGKDLVIAEEKKIRDKHKVDQTAVKAVGGEVVESEEKSAEKRSMELLSEKSFSNNNVVAIVNLSETKGSCVLKSELPPVIAPKENVMIQSVCSKKNLGEQPSEAVVSVEAASESLLKVNENVSVGKSRVEKSSQVQIGKDSSEKERSKPKIPDNKMAETFPRNASGSGKSHKLDESPPLLTVECKKDGISSKDKIDLSSVIKSEKRVSSSVRVDSTEQKEKPTEMSSSIRKESLVSSEVVEGDAEKVNVKSDDSTATLKQQSLKKEENKVTVDEKSKDNNSALCKMHSNNVSHVCENVPAKLKSSIGTDETLGDEKVRLPPAVPKEMDSKHTSTGNTACVGKLDTHVIVNSEEATQQEKSLSGDTSVRKKPQVLNVAIETVNEDINAPSNETSKRLSKSVPAAPVIVQKPVAAVISSLKKAPGSQDKDHSVSEDPSHVVADAKVELLASNLTKTTLPHSETGSSTKTVSAYSQPKETKMAERIGHPSIKPDVAVQPSLVPAIVNEQNLENHPLVFRKEDIMKTNVPISKNDESGTKCLVKEVDAIALKDELVGILVKPEARPDSEVLTSKYEKGRVLESTKKAGKVFDHKGKESSEEKPVRDIPIVVAKDTAYPKPSQDVNKNESKSEGGKCEKEVLPSKLEISKPIPSPKAEICLLAQNEEEKNAKEGKKSSKNRGEVDSAQNSGNGEESCKVSEMVVVELREKPVEDGKQLDNKTKSVGCKAKSESLSEFRAMLDIEREMVNKMPSESNPEAEKHFNGSKETSSKSERHAGIAEITTKTEDLKEKNASEEVILPKDDSKKSDEKSSVSEKKPSSDQEESTRKKAKLDIAQSLESKMDPPSDVGESKNGLEDHKESYSSMLKCDVTKTLPTKVEMVKVDLLQTVTTEKVNIKDEVCQESLSTPNATSSLKSVEKLTKALEETHVKEGFDVSNQEGKSSSLSSLEEKEVKISQVVESKSKADDIMLEVKTKSSELVDDKGSEVADIKCAVEQETAEEAAIGATYPKDFSSEKKPSHKDSPEKKESEVEVEDSSKVATSKIGGNEERTMVNKDSTVDKRAIDEEGSNSVNVVNSEEVCVTVLTASLSSNLESKHTNKILTESKSSEWSPEDGSEGTLKSKSGVLSPSMSSNDNDSSDGSKFKKRGDAKQSREKSILGITEKLVVANQMRQQKQGTAEPVLKESTSPRKMPGLIEMGVAKASRRKNLAVKDEVKIKKPKVVNVLEGDDLGCNKDAPDTVQRQIGEVVPKVHTPSNEEVARTQQQAETIKTLDPPPSKEGEEVRIPSLHGICDIIDLSSKKVDLKDQTTTVKDVIMKENLDGSHNQAAENDTTAISTEKDSLDMKPLSEGNSEGYYSTAVPCTSENVNSQSKGKIEERKDEGGFKFPRVKRNSGKDKTAAESTTQSGGPTTRTRAGFKPSTSIKPGFKQDDARERSSLKTTKAPLKKEEKALEQEAKRKSIELSTESFAKETEAKKAEGPLVEDVLSIRSSSSQSPISSSKLLEVIRVAGEKGRDVVKVNDVEVMREPVGPSSSSLSLLRKAAGVAPVFSSFSPQDQRKETSLEAKNVSEAMQTEVVSAGSKFPPGNTDSWEFVAKVGDVELLRESPRATPKAAPSPLTITVESPIKKVKDKPDSRRPGRPPSMPPPPKMLDYTVPPMNMLEQAVLAHQNFRNPSLEVLVGVGNRPDGASVDLRGQVAHMGMQMGSAVINPWQMSNEERGRSGVSRTAGMDFTGGRAASAGDLSSDVDIPSDKRKKGGKPRTAPPPKWSNQEADMLSVKVDGHSLGNWSPGDWRSLPPSSMPIWPPGFGYGFSGRPKGPMEPRCSRSVSPPSQSGRETRGVEQMPEDLSSPPLPRGRRDSPHSFRSPFVHPAVSFPGGTPNFSNVSVQSYPSHSAKSSSALNLAKSTASATPSSDTAMNLTMGKLMSATPPPLPVLSSPNPQSPRQSSLPVNLVKSRSSSPKGPMQSSPNFDGRGAVLPGGIVVPNFPLTFGRDYSLPTNTPSGRISHCSAEDSRETETNVSQVRCSSEPPRDHLTEKTRESATAFLQASFSQRVPTTNLASNFTPSRPSGNSNSSDTSSSRGASSEANLLPGGVVIPNLFGPNSAKPGEDQWSYEGARPDLPVRSASALSQYHTDEPSPKQTATPRLPTPVPPPPPPPPPPPLPPATSTPPPPQKTGPGRRGGRSETPPPDKYNFRVEEAHVVRSSDLGPGGGQGSNKLFACDICSGVYRRAFSLKRHYLRAHINYCHLSERDLSNCGIVVGDKMAVHTGGSGRRPYVHTTLPRSSDRSSEDTDRGSSSGGCRRTLLRDLFRCHTCGVCFDEKKRLKAHLMEHQCGSNRPSLLRQHAATHSPPVLLPKATALPKQHPSSPTPVVFLCAYCDKRFSSAAVRRRHRKLHESSPGPHPCYLCETAEDVPEVPLGETPSFAHLEDLRSHMASVHKEVYHSCALCGERLPTALALEEHAESHRSRRRAADASDEDEDEEDVELTRTTTAPSAEGSTVSENIPSSAAGQGEEEEFRYTCGVCQKMFTNYVNMCRHRRLAHGASQAKVVGRKAGSVVSGGKQGGGDSGSSSRSQSPVVVSQSGAGERVPSHRDLLDGEPSSSSSSSVPSPCPYPPSYTASANDPETIFYTRLAGNIRDNLLNYLDGKLDRKEGSDRRTREGENDGTYQNGEDSAKAEPYLSWEKYNFPKDFQQMSCWDISTQLVVRNNIKRANRAPSIEQQTEQRPAFPETLALVETARAAADRVSGVKEEEAESLEGVEVEGEWSGLSGEWVRPRSYICCACASRFGDLWSLEDHQLARHPNVWCTHLEVEDGAVVLPGSPKLSPGSANVAVSFLGDLLCRRPLGPRGALLAAPSVPPTLNDGMESPSAKCTKCSRLCPSLPDLHSHMLECGGDLAWAAWAGGSSPAAGSSRRNSRKWRPFGSRRRRQRGRRGMKRNIPSSPVKMHRARHRGTDSDSIQRMIANLPAKRATRRVIQFNEDDIKTRSQATIHSVSFPGNFVRVSGGYKTSQGVKPTTPTAAKRGRPPKNPVPPPPPALPLEGMPSTFNASPISVASPSAAASGASPPVIVVKKGRGRPPGSKSKPNVAGLDLPLKRRIGETSIEGASPEADRYALVKRSRPGASPINQHQSSSTTPNAPGEPYICKGCGAVFDNASSCERHGKKCVFRRQMPASPAGDGARVSSSGNPRPVHSCPHCGKNFTYATPMEKHVRACGGGSSLKGQPMHIRRATAPGVLVRPPVGGPYKVGEEEEVKKALEIQVSQEPAPQPPAQPQEPDMPQLQKEEPMANQLPKEEDIPVLTPVASDESEDKKEPVEEEIDKEAEVDFISLQESDKPVASESDTLITLVEGENSDIVGEDTNAEPLDASEIEIKKEVPYTEASQPVIEDSLLNSSDSTKHLQETSLEVTALEEKSEQSEVDKECFESLEDKLFRTTGKRTRGSSTSGQITKKNKSEDEVVEDVEEGEAQKKKPGRKTLVGPAKAKTPKSAKVTRGAKVENESINTEEEGERDTFTNASQQELIIDNKVEEIVESEETLLQKNSKSDVNVENEVSKVSEEEEKTKENVPATETKSKRGRKPKYPKPPATQESVAKAAEEKPDTASLPSCLENKMITSAESDSLKLPETSNFTPDEESKDTDNAVDVNLMLTEDTKEDDAKNSTVVSKEEKDKEDVFPLKAGDTVVDVKIPEEEKLVDHDASKSDQSEAAAKETESEMNAPKTTKEKEDVDDGDDEASADKDSKLRGTKGSRGKVTKAKKKKKKWQEIKKEVESFWCDVCQMGYSSAFNLVKHGMSQKHKWNLRLGKEKMEKADGEKENKESTAEAEDKGKVDVQSGEKDSGECSSKEQKIERENMEGKGADEEKSVTDEGSAATEKVEGEEAVNEEKHAKDSAEGSLEGHASGEVVASEDDASKETTDEKLKEKMAVEESTGAVTVKSIPEKSSDSSKSKESESAVAVRPAVDSVCDKNVSEDESKNGVAENEVCLKEEMIKKEDSSVPPMTTEEPVGDADAPVNVTEPITGVDGAKSSLVSKDKSDAACVSQYNHEKVKSNQSAGEDNDTALTKESENNITKVSPEAVVAAAPESATVIEGNKSTSEGIQRGVWQEVPPTPPPPPTPSQEFLQPPIPPPTSYNPLYEWDTNMVQPAPLQAQPGGPQHLHQTQQDGWGAYGGWEAPNADPNPPPSPGLWRYQPPTPIPWGEPQHSLSPIPRVPSYTEDPPPVTHPSPPNPSLGSILDSVNRILGEDGSGFDSTRMHAATTPEDEYGGVGLFGEGGLAELQRAMGATDEEMAMLQQLGTGPLDFVYDNNAGITSVTEGGTDAQDQTGPLPNAELVDLDNQAAAVTMVEEGPIEEAEAAAVPPIAVETSNVLLADGRGTKRKRCGPLPSKCKRLPPPNREGGRGWRGGRRPALAQASLASAHLLISQYEKKEMVCPVCNRHFLGLAALETHVAWVHKMKDAKQHILEGETVGHPSGKKATPTASNSLRELVVGRAGAGGGVVGGGGAASSPTPSRRLPCFVCKELYSDVISLNHHIAQQHLRRRPGEGGVVPDMDGDLKSQMTSALGDLLGKALANMRSRTDTSSHTSRSGGLPYSASKSPHLSFPKLNLLSKPLERMSPTTDNTVRKSFGGPSSGDGPTDCLTRAEPSSESPEVTLFRREDGVDPSEWSSDGEDSAKGHEIELQEEGVIPSFHHICPYCGDRFQKLSSRNRHISVAHRDPTCIDMMRLPRNISHENSDFDDLLSRSRKDDGDGSLAKDEASEETQETGRRHNHHPCPACHLSFLRHSQLEAHLKRAHNGADSQLPDTSDSMMECPICRESMNHFLKLCKHVKAKHREWSINCFTTDMHHHLILRKESPEESMVIRKKFLVKMKAFPVLRMASPTPSSKSSEEESYMDPDPKGNYLCSVCGVNFKSPQGVIRHLNLEHNSNHLEGALPMQKIFPRHASKEYRGRTGGGSGSDIKAKAEAALRELNLSQKFKLGTMAASKGVMPTKGTGSRKSEGGGAGEVQGVGAQARGGGRGRGSNRRGRGRRGGRVAASSDVEKSLFDVYEFEDDEDETEEAGSRVGSADGGSSRVDSECGGDDEEEEEGGGGEEEGKGSGAASIRAKRASVDSSSSEVKFSCNSCGKGYKSLVAFWKHTKGIRGACASGSCSPRSAERGQEVVLRGCKVSSRKGGKDEEEGSDAEGEAGGRVLRRLRGTGEGAPEAVEGGHSSETEGVKKAEKGPRKGKKKAAEEEKKGVFPGGETVRTYGGKRWVKQQQQAEERKGRGSEEGTVGRRSLGASEAAFDALRGGGTS